MEPQGYAQVAVLLAVGEPMFRLGLRAACEAAGFRVTADPNRDVAASLCDPAILEGVAVVEPELLEPDAARAVQRGAARHRVLLIGRDRLDKPRMLRAGASGFLPRQIDSHQLRDAILRANTGELVLSELEAPQGGDAPALAPHLTRREVDILRLLAAGHSTPAVAERLHVGAGTVKAHLRNASAKLGTRSRAAATAEATRLGLLG